MSVLGAVRPTLEALLGGELTDIPSIELVHPVLSLEGGDAYIARLEAAAGGERPPMVLVVEGALFDQALAGGGSFSGLGEHEGQPIPVEDWVRRIARTSAAVMAIGTCAVSGGIPAAVGNPTGAMSLTDLLGADFRSTAGLPVIAMPGCAPSGDAFIEALSYVVLHLQGLVPLDLDHAGRPAWLYAARTAMSPPDLDWLPADGRQHAAVVPCPVPDRGWINRVGGCAAVGGSCNGCTLPSFPDHRPAWAVPD